MVDRARGAPSGKAEPEVVKPMVRDEKGEIVARMHFEHEVAYFKEARLAFERGYSRSTLAYFPNGPAVHRIMKAIDKVIDADAAILAQEGEELPEYVN